LSFSVCLKNEENQEIDNLINSFNFGSKNLIMVTKILNFMTQKSLVD
jgi:hypothetical protein